MAPKVTGAVNRNPREKIMVPAFQIEFPKLQLSGHVQFLVTESYTVNRFGFAR